MMGESKQKKQVLSIRFRGFTEPWKQRKLGEIMNVTSVKRIHQSDWTKDGVRFLRARDIVSEFKGEDVADPLYISEERYDEYSCVSGKVRINDLLVTGVGSIGIPFLIRNDEPLYFKDGNIIWFRNDNKLNGRFFYYIFIGGTIQRFIRDVAGIGTVGTYTIENGRKTPIRFPKYEEQSKIGAFFDQVDNLITLHQRKCEQLKKVKKGLLQKLFPRDGKNVPELRFAGFTDAWKQCKLRDIARFSKGTGYSKEDLQSDGTPIILYGRLYTKYQNVISDIDTYAELRENIVLSKGNEVIVPASGETAEDISIASAIVKPGIILGGDLNIIYPDNNIIPEFLARTISNGDTKRNLSRRAQGKSVVHLRNDDLKKISICFPSVQEQKRITESLQNFDYLITLHQRKLEQLKMVKKALLQKMFV